MTHETNDKERISITPITDESKSMPSEDFTPATPYPNAPTGEHMAVFLGVETMRLHKGGGNRLLVHFLITNADGDQPLADNSGDNYYAVAVCNVPKGNNPKSKAYKIRKAMLLPDEYDPVQAAIGLPNWDYFSYSADSPKRVFGVRIKHVGDPSKPTSIVTHIKRMRDGEWENIEGVYEGQPNNVGIERSLPSLTSVKEGLPETEKDNETFYDKVQKGIALGRPLDGFLPKKH